MGNRRSRTTTTGLQTAGLSSYNSHAFDEKDRLTTGHTYDHNGNTLTGDTHTAPAQTASDLYDFENRLIKRTISGQTTDFIYDGDGNLVVKVETAGTDTKTTVFIVDDRNPTGYAQNVVELVSENEEPFEMQCSYLFGHQLIRQQRGTEPEELFGYDGHGNVRYLINDEGEISDTYTYDAFGVVIGQSGSTPNSHLYCGERFDAELGMYYLRARYLNPNSGRFWSMDGFEGTQTDPLSLHKYLYCHADPVNGWDPTGNMSMPESLSTTLVYTKIFGLKAFAAYQVYDKADTGWTVAVLVGNVATGGQVSIAQLAGLAVDFLPFGKLLKRLEDAGEMTLKGRKVLEKLHKSSGAEALGDAGALMAIRMKGFKPIGFVPGPKGIDDLVEDGAGNLIIVEAKGGTSGLKRVASGNQQMSKGWINEKIRELKDAGQDDLATRLEKARDSRTLKAMVVKTRASGPKAFDPDIQIKDWDDIGKIDWSE